MKKISFYAISTFLLFCSFSYSSSANAFYKPFEREVCYITGGIWVVRNAAGGGGYCWWPREEP